MRRLAIFAIAFAAAACKSSPDAIGKAMDSLQATYAPPEHLPVMLNHELPFHYPDALFSLKVQANVILGIYIDTSGVVWPESTKVLQSSGYAALDSAAVRGAPQLQFKPAMTKGKPVAVMIKLPVYFRYPGAPPLPGDSVLEPKAAPTKSP